MKVILVDGSNLARRNYHAQNLSTKDGTRTGCIYGSINSLYALQSQENADLVIVVWDAPGGSKYRKELYPDYKAQRDVPEANYIEDRDNLVQLLEAMGVTQITKDGVECDDIIGYLAKETYANDEVIIVSTDKDFYQLLDNHISIWSPSNMEYVPILQGTIPLKEGKKVVFIRPDQVPDYKALVGDKSDNIPGAMKFGIAAADSFFQHNDCIEQLYNGSANVDCLTSSARLGILQAMKLLKLYKDLATINIAEGQVDIPVRPSIRKDVVDALFEHYEFKHFTLMGEKIFKIGGII